MALNRGREVFTQQWVNRLAPGRRNTMPCEIELYDPKTSGGEFNYETGEWTTGVDLLYHGMARVQPIRSSSSINNGPNATTVQSVLFSIPIELGKNLDIRTYHRGRVRSAPLMPVLTRFSYVVQEVMDSANAIERTFLMRVDQERVENG